MNVKLFEISTSSCLNLHIVLVLSTLDLQPDLSTLDLQPDDGHYDGPNM